MVYNIGDRSTPCDLGATGHGIYSATPGATVVNNLVYNTRGYGIHYFHDPRNGLIANNTVVNAGGPRANESGGTYNVGGGITVGGQVDTVSGGEHYGEAANTKIINSIVVSSGGPGISLRGNVGVGNVIDINLLYSNDSDFLFTNGAVGLNLFPEYNQRRPDVCERAGRRFPSPAGLASRPSRRLCAERSMRGKRAMRGLAALCELISSFPWHNRESFSALIFSKPSQVHFNSNLNSESHPLPTDQTMLRQ